MTKDLSELGTLLQQSLRTIDTHERAEQKRKGATLNTPSVATALLSAYEQLRNASENIEDHLLLQSAILRFYRRNLSFQSKQTPKDLGRELVIELTQAAYLDNNSTHLRTVEDIERLIIDTHRTYTTLRKEKGAANAATTETWLYELLSVKTEQMLHNPIRILTFAQFAHVYFSRHVDYAAAIKDASTISDNDHGTLLYIAIHRALLRSSDANIRSALLDLYDIKLSDSTKLLQFNKQYDKLSKLDATSDLARFVTRNGALLRILRAGYFEHNESSSTIDLTNKTQTNNHIDVSIDREYERTRKSINRGIVKSIVFLFITKALIGLLIEIPYDLIVLGSIIVLPLALNLLFPPLFIALSALTLRLPGPGNKIALLEAAHDLLYDNTHQPSLRYIRSAGRNTAFNIVFGFIFLGVFYLVGSWLAALGFTIVQGLIFVVFLSTASFLSYRLSIQIKELEVTSAPQGLLSLIRDFFYTPFIIVGQKISYRFGQLNIIAQILDAAIDLPLKTIVRLVRQWMVFLGNKRDELL